jgi:hypothetical protein
VLRHSLLTVAKHKDSRSCLSLLAAILENPGLAERLLDVLKPDAKPARAVKGRKL